jgi:hypothetical protein
VNPTPVVLPSRRNSERSMKNGPDGLGGGSDGHRWRHEHRSRTPILLVLRGGVRRSPEVLPELWRRAAASGARSDTVQALVDVNDFEVLFTERAPERTDLAP